MSYKTWITYGYGVKVSDIERKDITADDLANFIHLAPYFEEKFIRWLNTNYPETPYEIASVETLLEYEDEDSCYVGLTPIIKGVLDEVEGLYFVMCHNFDNEFFVLFTPAYPWEMGKKEREMSQNEVEKIFKKYLEPLIHDEIEVDFYEVENGG